MASWRAAGFAASDGPPAAETQRAVKPPSTGIDRTGHPRRGIGGQPGDGGGDVAGTDQGAQRVVWQRESLVVVALDAQHPGDAGEHGRVELRLVLDRGRAHRVDADAVRGVVKGERPRQSDQAVLRRHVVGEEGKGHHSRSRGHVHDRAAAPAHHAGQDSAGAAEGAAQVDVEHDPPRLLVELVCGCAGRTHQAGIVHQHVDLTQLVARPRHRRIDLLLHAHVGARGEHADCRGRGSGARFPRAARACRGGMAPRGSRRPGRSAVDQRHRGRTRPRWRDRRRERRR